MKLKNKKILFTLLIFLSLVLPLYQAHAFVTYLASLIASYIISAILTLFVGLSYYFLQASVWFMGFVQSESFINWTYTGMDNPIIEVGWTLARDLTNMFFIIILVFIGLATALKLDQYRYQKLIPRLIGVALLINFSPVICGAIIDFSNILTNFFLGQYSGGEFLTQFAASQRVMVANAFGGSFFNPLTAIGRVVQLLLLVAFNFTAALIYLLFSFIFAGRYIALWILVALSPFAFFSYAIPQLGSFWKQWWNNFIQWCLIGVSAGFFLYIGKHVLVRAPEMMAKIPPSSAGIEYFLLEFMYSIIPLSLGLGVLVIGLMTALKSGPTGAKWAIAAAKWSEAKVGGFVSQQTLGRVATSKFGRNVLEGKAMDGAKAKFKESKLGQGWDKALTHDNAWIRRSTKTLSFAGKAVNAPFSRGIAEIQKAGLKYSAGQRKSVSEAGKEFKEQYGDDVRAMAVEAKRINPLDWAKKIALVQRMAEEGGEEALDLLPSGYVEGALNQIRKTGSGSMIDIIKHVQGLVLDENNPNGLTKLGEKLEKDLVDEKIIKELNKLGVESTHQAAIAINAQIHGAIKDNKNIKNRHIKGKHAQKALAWFSTPARQQYVADNTTQGIDKSVFTGSAREIAQLSLKNTATIKKATYHKPFSGMIDESGFFTPERNLIISEAKSLNLQVNNEKERFETIIRKANSDGDLKLAGVLSEMSRIKLKISETTPPTITPHPKTATRKKGRQQFGNEKTTRPSQDRRATKRRGGRLQF